MSDPNVYEREHWEADYRDRPVKSRVTRVGAAAGARELGAAVFELEPGGAVAPYHLHHGNEEMLVVLAGRPLLRTPQGTRTLEPGAVVAFLPGPGGAHRITNPTDEAVRVLLISTMSYPEVAEHLSTGTVMAMTAPGQGKVFAGGTERPFLEMYLEALVADREQLDSE
jgi:uncharacterized cupin superfamily protein